MVAGCKYGPVYGEPCVGGTPAECTSHQTAAYCEMAAWDEYTCASECGADGGCDWSKAVAGTHCPDSADGYGFCTSPTSAMRCVRNRFEPVVCSKCTVLQGRLSGVAVCY